MAAQIAYECVAPSHQAGRSCEDRLTIHERQWAFCPYCAQAEGHEWKATGGRPLFTFTHPATKSAQTPTLDEGKPQ